MLDLQDCNTNVDEDMTTPFKALIATGMLESCYVLGLVSDVVLLPSNIPAVARVTASVGTLRLKRLD